MSIPKEMALCYLRKIATSKDVGVMCALVEKEKKAESNERNFR